MLVVGLLGVEARVHGTNAVRGDSHPYLGSGGLGERPDIPSRSFDKDRAGTPSSHHTQQPYG